MIIEYTRKATCKDCRYCGYYHPIKKDGSKSAIYRHKCKLTNQAVRLSDYVCDRWKIGFGIPEDFSKINSTVLIYK